MRTTAVATLSLLFAAAACSRQVPARSQAELGNDPIPADSVAEPEAIRPLGDSQHRGKVIIDGAPTEIPDELRERLGQYLDVRTASLQALSADASEALIATRFASTQQIHRVRGPLAARTQLTFAEEPVSAASYVPGTTGEIVYRSDRGGDEQYRLFHHDLATGVATPITPAATRTLGYAWAPDGSVLAFSNNARNGRDFDIWLGDGRDPESARMLAATEGAFYPLEISADGAKLLVWEYVSSADQRVHLVDMATGEMAALTPDEPRSSHHHAVFAKGGARVYITSDREGEFAELYEIEVATGEWRPITRDISWDVTNLAIGPSGRTLAYTTNEGGVDVLRLLDTLTGIHRQVEGVAAGVISELQFAADAPILGFTVNAPRHPNDVYTLDLRRSDLVRWTESEVGGLSEESFVEPEIIAVKSFDGLEVPGLYYAPPTPGPHPVVIYIHGGPESQSRPWFASLAQFSLIERGIALVYPNVRGSTGYGKTYLSLDDQKNREDAVRDIGAFLDWIDENPDLDGDRVAVVGASYGGYMVLASLIHFGDRLRAGITSVGISNFVTFLDNTADYRRDIRRAEYGDERDPQMRAFLQRISPLSRADEIGGALFVAHGANDPRVPASEAEQIVEAVRAAGHEVWYMLALNEGHGFRRRENLDLQLQLLVLFYEEHLLGTR
jgi:dipeptidyl aminopeptidase/acylaminoacyl peptidase